MERLVLVKHGFNIVATEQETVAGMRKVLKLITKYRKKENINLNVSLPEDSRFRHLFHDYKEEKYTTIQELNEEYRRSISKKEVPR